MLAICININLMLWKHLWVRLLSGQFPHTICGTRASKLLFGNTGSRRFVGQAFKIIFEHWSAERHADISDIPRKEKVENPQDASWGIWPHIFQCMRKLALSSLEKWLSNEWSMYSYREYQRERLENSAPWIIYKKECMQIDRASN